MIKLNININPDDILSNRASFDSRVLASLKHIDGLMPNHKEGDFKNNLWGYFKQAIWEQQGRKCAFCEKEILSLDDSQVEHFRPKAEVHDKNNNLITREAYWWLAYDHKNYIVSCATCNNQKGNIFPIKDNGTRVTATDMNSIIALTDEGVLGDEIPNMINPRYNDPEPHLAYNYQPDIPMVYVKPKDDDDIGKTTIDIIDLNRIRKNKKAPKDSLPHKRGLVLSDFDREIKNLDFLKRELNKLRCALAQCPENEGLQKIVDENTSNFNKKRDIIKELFLSQAAKFSGMCIYWLKNTTDLEDDFMGGTA